MCAVLGCANFITEVFRGGTEQYTTKSIKLLICDNSDIETTRNKLESVTSCSELVPEDFSKILESEAGAKKELRIEDGWSA